MRRVQRHKNCSERHSASASSVSNESLSSRTVSHDTQTLEERSTLPDQCLEQPDIIDLTINDRSSCSASGRTVVDLTSPPALRGVNDSSFIVINPSPARTREDLSILILSSDSESNDELTELDTRVRTVPTAPIVSSGKNISTNSPKLSCPICMDDYTEIKERGGRLASTTCGHLFCINCIKSAVDAHKQCPLCRTKLNHRNYHTLHL